MLISSPKSAGDSLLSITAKQSCNTGRTVRRLTIGKTLRDELAGLRSYRVARFRIIYRVAGTVIEIVAVGPRRTIYEETWRRFADPPLISGSPGWTTFPTR